MVQAQKSQDILVIRTGIESGKLDNLINRYDYSNLVIIIHIYR